MQYILQPLFLKYICTFARKLSPPPPTPAAAAILLQDTCTGEPGSVGNYQLTWYILDNGLQYTI